jgi:PAS domain S-box-containing protein
MNNNDSGADGKPIFKASAGVQVDRDDGLPHAPNDRLPLAPVDQSLVEENIALRARLAEARDLLRALGYSEADSSTEKSVPRQLFTPFQGESPLCGSERHVSQPTEANDRLLETEQAFRILAEAVPHMVWATRADGWNTYFNQQWYDYTGMTPEQSRGGGWNIPFHPDDRPRSWEAWQRATQHREAYALECRLRRADGTYRWYLIRGAPLLKPDGQVQQWFGTCTDIEDLKQTEASLRDSEQLFRRVFDDAAMGIVLCDAQGRFQNANPAFCALLGYSFAELKNGQFESLIHPDDRELNLERVTSLLENRLTDLDIENRYIRKDGSTVWVRKIVSILRDDSGTATSLLALVTDVTQRKIDEGALRDSEQRFRAIADSIPQLAWMADASGYIGWFNQGWLNYTGTTLEENQGTGWKAVHHSDYVNAVAERFERALTEGEDWEDTFPLRRKDGQFRWFLSRMNAIRDEAGNLVRFFGTNTDVTERRHQEEALRESEQRLSQALDAAQLGTFELDLETGETIRSLRHDQCFGYAQAVPEWSFEIATSHVLTEDLQIVLDAHAQASTTGQFAFEVRLVWPDGSIHWIAARATTRFNSQGRATRLVGLVSDVTDRRQMEQVLRDADRRKDAFLATLAHELRNPLAPVRNVVQLLHLESAALPRLQWATDVIDRQMQTMTRLIDDLMDVSRINRGRIELQRKPVELAEVVQCAVETSRPLLDECGHQLTVTLPTDRVILDADLTRLAQVFINLLNNAAKYMQRGGRIELRGHLDGNDVVVSIKDTGIGIAGDQLGTIFGMFSQIEDARAWSQGGLGIGLGLVKQLVDLHGGQVEARSEGPGKGSEFVVHLPTIEGQTFVLETTDDKRLTPISDLRILVVDDNRDATASLAMLLEVMGNGVRTAYDGEEAVAAAEAFRPHVVLCDIGLPTINGYEVCRRIRQQPWGRSVTLVAVTGWGEDDAKRQAAEAGFDQHVVKPVDPQVLMALLANLEGQI